MQKQFHNDIFLHLGLWIFIPPQCRTLLFENLSQVAHTSVLYGRGGDKGSLQLVQILCNFLFYDKNKICVFYIVCDTNLCILLKGHYKSTLKFVIHLPSTN